MDQPVISSAPATSAPAPSMQTEARLERIEKSLETLIQRQQPVPTPAPAHSTESEKSNANNKPLLALLFGFAGFKIGGGLGFKFGMLGDMARAYYKSGWKGVSDIFETVVTLGANFRTAKETLKYTITGMAAGTAIGTLGGIWVGLARGDRIKNPSDLIMHPIDSMKKIFGKAPPTQPTTPLPATNTPVPEDTGTGATVIQTAQHEGTVATEPLKAAQR